MPPIRRSLHIREPPLKSDPVGSTRQADRGFRDEIHEVDAVGRYFGVDGVEVRLDPLE